MTFQLPADATYPTPDQIRDTVLRAIRFNYLRIGIQRNVAPQSDDYVRVDKLASRIGIAIANNEISAANSDPLTATGTALVNLSGVFGVFPRPAAPAAGFVNVTFAGSSVTIPSGWTGTAPDGNKYLATPGTYLTGVAIPVIAVAQGASTNKSAGVVITWDSAAIGALSPNAVVATGGLTNGVDTDDQETLRQRLLRRLSAAAVGGNWSSIVGWAEDASASVQQAYCYPAAEGSSSFDVAVTAVGGNRTVNGTTIAQISAYILAQMPGEEQINVTTVTPQGVDVSLAMRLPLPQTAGGVGGGWLDAVPWPQEDCKVTAYNTGTSTATVNSVVAPLVGSSIGIWNPNYVDPTTQLVVGQMIPYSVATVGGSASAWTITVQNSFQVSPLGQYVSAGSNYLTDYADTFAAAAAVLGPGQKTAMPELLPRATRQPSTDVSSPSDLTSRLLDAVQTPYSEIEDLEWGIRYAAGTTSPLTSPSLPTTTADPPNILVLNSIAFRYEP